MIPRRDLVTGGVLSGLLGALAPEVAVGDVRAADSSAADTNAAVGDAAAEPPDPALARIASELADLRAEVHSQRLFTDIAAVRDAQKTFLRGNSKFPDFIDVGADVWLNAHDWHVRWMQPLTLGRDAQGRYTLTLLGTTLVMRVDVAPNFVGLPYDGR